MRRRYGKPEFRAFLPVWLGMMAMFELLMGSFVFRGIFFTVFPLLVWACLLLLTFLPFREKFSIEKDRIIARKGRQEESIALPDELLLVISRASIPVPIRGRGFFLKRKLAISLLEYMEPGEFLERLHGERGFRYTNETLEVQFRYRWIYSFVLDMESVKKLAQGRRCCIIVPESLRGRMDLDDLNAEIFSDEGY